MYSNNYGCKWKKLKKLKITYSQSLWILILCSLSPHGGEQGLMGELPPQKDMTQHYRLTYSTI